MSHAIDVSAGPLFGAGRFRSAVPPSLSHPTRNSGQISFSSNIALQSPRSSRSVRPVQTAAAAGSSLCVSTESFYDLLGIPVSGTLPEIKQAYRQLTRKYHPDVSPPEKAEEYTRRFLEVQEAYETLSDPESRAQYDRELASGFHLAFSARKQFHKGMDPQGEWKQRWETQIDELQSMRQRKQRYSYSWGDRMRSQRSCQFSFN
ncbi:unnamed protein product [Linum trigynum]|uniref:J domain-containing protein n=1 Tax=Linum trigynum TaxID=586398 RepID=A0AAV2GNI6_9ROSI